MNGLQIIKTLALKIRYASIVEWYNFWSIVLQHHQNIVPTVASIDETIRHITEGNRSISRFGDGEMLLTSPSKSIGFQEGSPLLAKRLREVLVSHEEGHLVAIPDVFSGLNRYRRKCRRFQRTHFFIYGKWWDQLLIPGRKYENAFLSRPYMDYTSKEHCARWFRELKTIWEGRDIVFIEGAMSRLKTMRMEMVSFSELVLNPVAQVKFVHTVASGYVTGAMFILGISAWYMLKGRDFAFAKRSFAIAASFGMAAVLSVIVLGDESGYEMGDVQKTKLAAIEAEWETQPAPAAFTLFGIPDQEEETNKFAIQIPYALGIIATRSVDTPVIGLKELMVQHEERIRNGMKAYSLLEQLRSGSTDQAVRDQFNSMKKDLGYGLLLKRYTPNVADATEAQIQQATKDSIPRVAPLYFAFRIMVACGFLLLAIIALSFWSVIRNRIGEKKWLLRAALYGIPLPWIAVEAGWFVAEYGRQPWAIGEVLPTAVANSSLTAGDLIFSMVLICGLYTLFLVAELFLMFKFARLGPSSLKTGRYHFEQSSTTTQPAR